MKVLVCGEGDHDIGCTRWNAKIQDHVFLDGWLQPIVRSMTDVELEVTAVRHSELVVLPREAAKHRPLPGGHGAKSFAASFRAKSMNISLVIFMTDADSSERTRQKEKAQSIRDGFDHSPYDVIGVPCVPMGTSESWLLADEEAWHAVAGLDVALGITKAEELWGDRHDPMANHPKHVFARTCLKFDLADDRATRNDLARVINVEKLRINCPSSYAPFEKELLSMPQLTPPPPAPASPTAASNTAR